MEIIDMTKPVAPTIAAMEVGQSESWPIERYEVVRSTATRLMAKMRRSGIHYTVRNEDLVTVVTRDA